MADRLDLLAYAQQRAGAALDEIRGLFRPGVKITLAVRSPEAPDRDFLMSDDDLAEVAAMIERRRAALAKAEQQ